MSEPLGRRPSYAVRISRPDGRWAVELLAKHAGEELEVLEEALGEFGQGGWPPPVVVVVDAGLFFVALRHGPGGMVRALISDASMQEWVLVSEVLERYGIGAEKDFLYDDDESASPDGDLDLFADDGLPEAELRPILTADDLWADEMVERIATRLGFADELAAAVAP